MAVLFRNVTEKKPPSLITTFRFFITLILTSLLTTPLEANNNGSATTNPTGYELFEGYGFQR
ncbi:hypothetical protein FRX31_002547, partial [Thalictrum thalictroides]